VEAHWNWDRAFGGIIANFPFYHRTCSGKKNLGSVGKKFPKQKGEKGNKVPVDKLLSAGRVKTKTTDERKKENIAHQSEDGRSFRVNHYERKKKINAEKNKKGEDRLRK